MKTPDAPLDPPDPNEDARRKALREKREEARIELQERERDTHDFAKG